MRIDVILESNNAPETILRLGRLAEDCGLGGVWVSNMNDARDPFMNFVPLAGATRRVRIGPIAVSPFELHPLKMAGSLLTLNEMAGGRAQIVVGAGGGTAAAMGAKPRRVVRAVRECVDILRAAASGRPVSYKGELFSVRWYDASWARSPAPMIYVGANGPQMLASAARHADGIMVSDFVVEHVRHARQIIDDAMAAAGRDAAGFELNNFWAWHVKESADEAQREARTWLAVRGTIYPKYIGDILEDPAEQDIVNCNIQSFIKAYHRKSPEVEGVPETIMKKLVAGCTSAAPLDDIGLEIERLKAFRDAGLTQIALRIYDEPDAAIRIIGEHVVPALA